MPWIFLLIGYCVTVAVETPVLLVGLAPVHPRRRRLFAGLWLTACTYPVFILTLPELFHFRSSYLIVGETLVTLAECALFLAAFGRHERGCADRLRDCAAIVLANLASFGVGEWLNANGWFGWLEAV